VILAGYGLSSAFAGSSPTTCLFSSGGRSPNCALRLARSASISDMAFVFVKLSR
jgi:hypothetical protein